MTSLIDVIFLLLLFFMLTSTFSKFSEVDLVAAASGTQPTSDIAPLFLRLSSERLGLNGSEVGLDTLADALADRSVGTDAAPQTVLVSMMPGVSAQRLTDVLVALRTAPGLRIAVLE
ncbi:MAG: biopolymer transporter ExbD [Pseudomonadota bacterium]